MNKVKKFYDLLISEGVGFFSGVPDSILEDFCAFISNHVTGFQHIIAANEGGAIALATGYHLATGKIPLVYMQNSGLGNAINPLLSLADAEVYSIPMLLLIGWRGRPGEIDEPQHVKQGRVQNALLEAMEIKYLVLENDYEKKVRQLIQYAYNQRKPVVLVCPKDFWGKEKVSVVAEKTTYELTREKTIRIITSIFSDSVFISTTGKTSRELFEIRKKRKDGHERDFLSIGGMGHCSQIALCVALFCKNKHVVCIDGDGSLLMHLGSLPIIGAQQPKNLLHILINNGVHESVGGQKTVAFNFDFSRIAKKFGFKYVSFVETEKELKAELIKYKMMKGTNFIEVRVRPGSRRDLGRPTETPIKNKELFMRFIQEAF